MEKIEKPDIKDYPQLLQVWEASVRATHHFLAEEDITWYKQQMPHYFKEVSLLCMKDESDRIFALMGTHQDKIEMLFIHPDMRGKGYGKLFIRRAIDELGMSKVDVNEQNTQGVGFYQKMGFKVISRSEKDGEGKDYPILHLSL